MAKLTGILLIEEWGSKIFLLTSEEKTKQSRQLLFLVMSQSGRFVIVHLTELREQLKLSRRNSNVPLVEIPELIECCWGEKEGQVKGTWTENWIAGALIPGAETYENFLLCAVRGINAALLYPGPVLIVSHGGLFWGVQEFAHLGSRFDLGNCTPVLLRAPSIPNLPWGLISIDPSEDFERSE